MKKVIYEGPTGISPYESWRFSGFMEGLLADGMQAGSLMNNRVYHLNDVTVVWSYTGITQGSIGVPTCRVTLMGDRDKLSKVEKIIKTEQDRLDPKHKLKTLLEQ